MLPFHLTFQPGLPPSDQLVECVKKSIATGDLCAGTPFPSVRTLSKELRISPTTAHKAVAALKSEGWLESLPGVGMRVSAQAGSRINDRLSLLRPLVETLVQEAQDLQVSDKQLLSLLRGYLSPSSKPSSSKPSLKETSS